jgi:hypothetical protein
MSAAQQEMLVLRPVRCAPHGGDCGMSWQLVQSIVCGAIACAERLPMNCVGVRAIWCAYGTGGFQRVWRDELVSYVCGALQGV